MSGPWPFGGPLQLIDVWDPATVLAAMLDDEVGSGFGATYFLTSLLDHPDFDPERHAPLMGRLALGGSPIPTEVARRSARHLVGPRLRLDRAAVDHDVVARRS